MSIRFIVFEWYKKGGVRQCQLETNEPIFKAKLFFFFYIRPDGVDDFFFRLFCVVNIRILKKKPFGWFFF